LSIQPSGKLDNYLLENKTNSDVIVFTYNTTGGYGKIKCIILDKNAPSALQVVKYLYNENICSLFIEGGAEILNHFIENGLWDETRVFTGNVNFGDGVKAPFFTGKAESIVRFEKSSLKVFLNM